MYTNWEDVFYSLSLSISTETGFLGMLWERQEVKCEMEEKLEYVKMKHFVHQIPWMKKEEK